MPLSFTVAPHPANKINDPYQPITTPDQLLALTWGQKAKTTRCTELLQSSLVDPDFSRIAAVRNGFVNTVIDAYNEHYHLILR